MPGCPVLLGAHQVGAMQGKSEETKVGGSFTSGPGEVWIYRTPVSLAEEKQCEWVDSAPVAQGEARGKTNVGRIHNVDIMCNSVSAVIFS